MNNHPLPLRRLKAIAIGILAIPVVFAGFIAYFFLLGPDLCGNTLLNEFPSPNGTYKAVVFERSCGATSGLSTQVSVLDARGVLANQSGNVLIADTNGGAVASGPGGGPAVQVNWISLKEVQLIYSNKVRMFKAATEVNQINVLHKYIANDA